MLVSVPLPRRAALLAVATTALVLVGCSRETGGGAQAASAAAAPPEVGVVTLTQRPLTLVNELPGRVSASLVAEVRPQVGGIVQTRAFTEGSDVKAGELLYQIDPSTYRATLQSADAALAKAEANLVVAKAKAERYKDLVGIDAVNKQAADETVAAAAQAVADVAAAKAAREMARINLDYTRVTSPISGRIGRSSVTAGALVTANQANPLATVQRLDTIYVDVTQSSVELLRLRRELAAGRLQTDKQNRAVVRLRLEDGSLYPLIGTLQFADVTVDETTSAVTLRATFPNPKELLLPGMYVRAVVEEGVRDGAITVPQRAVTRNNRGEPMALVVGEDGKVELRPIVIPRTIGDEWLVDAGLKAGERVIVEGLQKARPGAVVRAVPASPAAVPAANGAASAPQPPGGGASSQQPGTAGTPAASSGVPAAAANAMRTARS